jgi:hypothetical protein
LAVLPFSSTCFTATTTPQSRQARSIGFAATATGTARASEPSFADLDR